MKTVHVIILLIASLSLIEAVSTIFLDITLLGAQGFKEVCRIIENQEPVWKNKKHLCEIELFDEREETPKCLLCPDYCNSDDVVHAVLGDKAVNTQANSIKLVNKAVTDVNKKIKDICAKINISNAHFACQKVLFQGTKKENKVNVGHVCKKKCQNYFKVIAVMEKECKYEVSRNTCNKKNCDKNTDEGVNKGSKGSKSGGSRIYD